MFCLRKEGLRIAALASAIIAASSASAEYDWAEVKDALDESPFQRGALIVYHKGEEVYRTGFGWWDNYSNEQLANLPAINVASLSKTYTAALAMTITEDTSVGISLSDLVKDYITNATTFNTNKINATTYAYDVMTVDNLITMTSSHNFFLPWPTNLLTCINNPLYSFEGCGESMVQKNLEKPSLFATYVIPPGTAFGYTSAAWQILGLVLLNAVNDAHSTSIDFTTLLEDYLTGEGACDLAKTTITPANNEWAAGGVETDLVDGGKFAQALLSGVCGDSHTLLSSTSQAAMETNTMPSEVIYNPDTTGLGYGRGGFLYEPSGTTSTNIFMGAGAWGATVFYSRDAEWAAYLHLDDHVLSGYEDAIALAKELVPLIDDQADANP
ncbi:MAG TPA: serine hydrolase domain-containing protein [Parvularculaceae bacterium]|nr:beta-lactamase family protein [Amphiplicatus sp.]HOP18541.1 serine hydrolase domain-containing protein [Amphiplicatus sp.]HPE29683.1 serine hydrolase domain-containing protein [Parvularculaceae bacterium]HRX38330.1 serine hydrolase domain-containing protein [Parvularculaceae bacterium]